jgi:preprotein translocase subunit SecD
VTHLLAALALMTLGSGPIRGFGVTLFIGILTSMFTSVTVTHAITNLVRAFVEQRVSRCYALFDKN